jgi:hypothetical protein
LPPPPWSALAIGVEFSTRSAPSPDLTLIVVTPAAAQIAVASPCRTHLGPACTPEAALILSDFADGCVILRSSTTPGAAVTVKVLPDTPIAAVLTVNERVAGVGSVTPTAVARTANV